MIPDTVLLQTIKLFQETSTVSICKSKVDSAEGIYRNPYVNNCLGSNIELMNCIDSVSLILRLPKTDSTWKKSCTIKWKMFIPWERTLNSTTMHLHRSYIGSMGEYVGSKLLGYSPGYPFFFFDTSEAAIHIPPFQKLCPPKLTWIPKMMVWERKLLLTIVILGIYVGFLDCTNGRICTSATFVGELNKISDLCLLHAPRQVLPSAEIYVKR